MKRFSITPRVNYAKTIESLGFYFHPDYWKEDAYYSFNAAEVESIYKATEDCYKMYCDAVEHCINDDKLLDLLKIPIEMRPWIRESWDRDDLSLYGRFDFAFVNGVPKLLEFNADTPTSLLEASVIQWQWKEDRFPDNDQFNDIHEALVQSFKDIHEVYKNDNYVFASFLDDTEDNGTTSYLVACANEAGLTTTEVDIRDIKIDEDCLLPDNTPVKCCFKLYPWEMMFRENPYGCTSKMRWIEPLWKSLMSNKAMLPILYSLYPNSPYILPAYFDSDNLKDYCKKPIFSREGANVELVKGGMTIEKTEGEYGSEGHIYQQLVDMPSFGGNYPIIGSWVIGGESHGIGIRETKTKVTDNMSNFVPHIII